jgi:hypothetical protein
MRHDTECPYCGEGQDINHDDGYGYAEDRRYEQECPYCCKTFVFETHYTTYYTVNKADCLNGAEHRLESVFHVPNHWPNWVRCKDCGYENRGEVKND